MKKLYSTIVAACATIAATAAVPTMKMANGTLTATNSVPKLEKHITKHTERLVVEQNASKVLKAPAKAHENDQWESVGEGTLYEGIVCSLFGIETPSYKVPVEKSTTTKGLYRVVGDPYKVIADGTQGLFKYDSAKAQTMYLQVVDDDKFYVEGFDTGLYSNHPEVPGEVVVLSNTQSLVEGNGLEMCLEGVPGAFGKFKDGVFSYPSPSFTLGGNKYYSLLLQFSGVSDLYAGNVDGEFKLVLPDATFADYSISMDYETCQDDKFTFQFTLGADVENYKVFVAAGEYALDNKNFELVAKDGQNVTKDQKAFVYTPAANAEEGIYSIFAVTVDAEGKFKEGVRGLFFVQHDNNDKWKTLDGKALYTDDFVASIYQDHADVEREVTIQESLETPGFYRLVNAYAAPYKYASNFELSCTHNHYLYINAADPAKVYIPESAIGFAYDDGAMTVCSMAYQKMQYNEATTDADWGTLKDNTITFPNAKTLFARELKYRNGAWYYANGSSAFKVKLPDQQGVSSIVADTDLNAPAEYFNLQGQRIDNPTPGQLVVKRQGNTVQKMIVR